MSSSTPAAATAAPAEAPKRKDLVEKYVEKFKKGLRRMSTVSKPKAKETTATGEAPPREGEPSASAAPISPETKPAEAKGKAAEAEPTKPEIMRTVSGPQYLRSALQQERARALFAKYGLTLETPDWLGTAGAAPVANAQRVEKPIRMRVRRTCHRCNASFGADRICTSCDHKRCKKCPRYPPKKGKAKKEKEPEPVKLAEGRVRAYAPGPLTAEVKAAGLVTPRTKRTCHKCDTEFVPRSARVCPNCAHLQCVKCPKEALKNRQWPSPYAGEVQSEDSEADMVQKVQRIYRKPRQRVRWTCDQCTSMFTEGIKVCGKCQHKRCDKCIRIPPKKSKKDPDPEVLKSVERKLANLMKSETPAVS